MSIRTRLQRLEDHTGSVSRCSNCRTWPEIRVDSNDWRTNLPTAPATPARCEGCGFEPTTVVVEEIEDWRGERARNPE